MKVFTDRHHEALFKSFQFLFEDRLEWELFEPHGIEWFDNNLWFIGNPYGESARNTALQFLESHTPSDGTETLYPHRGITLDEFKETKFDFLIASYIDHIPVYRELINQYQPKAKLIVQLGNSWNLSEEQLGMVDGVMASIKPFPINNKPVVFYHQEFRTPKYRGASNSRTVASFVNALNINEIFRQDWNDFLELEQMLPEFSFRSYGGGCRDGSLAYNNVFSAMQDTSFIVHFKSGGDGFGHNLYSAAALGIPLIYKGSQYKNKLGEELLLHNATGFDLEKSGSITNVAHQIRSLTPEGHCFLSTNLFERFKQVVNFDREFLEIQQFLEHLIA